MSETRKKQLKEVHDTIANQLNASDLRQLETMGKHVVAMEADFAKVHACIKIFDGLGVVLDGNRQVIRLAPEWISLHEEYTFLMNKSQENATVLNVKIQELLDVFLPSTASAGNKEIKFDEYIVGLEEFYRTGTNNVNRFSRLRENVAAFQEKLHDITPSQTASVKEQLKNLDADIHKLVEEIREPAKFLGESWYNHAIKLREGLVKVNKPAVLKGNTDDDELEAFTRLRMRSLKNVYFALQETLNTYALSVAQA
ncbi:hypothetical protein GALMADRAFT_147746 [Galerina marginata CBS 339.88]|uniref:Uncharacterized protein n=1 Tax=Galerina marginata (strain CBS 339.88) TaxID=685588 RepID=A0A067S768_GALM3|nr:hypothetical protein GALMADRAFT_147746 [Galerina marginata CBS 339.88]